METLKTMKYRKQTLLMFWWEACHLALFNCYYRHCWHPSLPKLLACALQGVRAYCECQGNGNKNICSSVLTCSLFYYLDLMNPIVYYVIYFRFVNSHLFTHICLKTNENVSFFHLDINNGVPLNWQDALRQHLQQRSLPFLQSAISSLVSFLFLLLAL